jgi:hypothetical protein
MPCGEGVARLAGVGLSARRLVGAAAGVVDAGGDVHTVTRAIGTPTITKGPTRTRKAAAVDVVEKYQPRTGALLARGPLVVSRMVFALLGFSALVTEIATLVARGRFVPANFFS